MKLTSICLLSLLFAFAFATRNHKCDSLSTLPNGKKNLREILSRPSVKPVPNNQIGNKRVIFLDTIGGVETETVITEFLNEDDFDFNFASSFKIGDDGMEDELVTCQTGESSFYIQRTMQTKSSICKKITPSEVKQDNQGKPIPPRLAIKDGVLTGELDLIPGYYTYMEFIGQGGYGTVKGIVLPTGESIAIKRATPDKVGVSEIVVTKKFSNSPHGSSFKGCFEDSKFVYVAQERFVVPLTDSSLLKNFRGMPQKNRMEIIVDMAKALKEFSDSGWVHNDIKLDNMMLSKNGLVHLIDFGASARVGAVDKSIGTRLYISPHRSSLSSDPINDLYSLAVSLLAMESPLEEACFGLKWGTANQVDSKTFPRDPKKDPDHHFETVIQGVLGPNWGQYSQDETDPAKMNLTTLVMNIAVKLNRSVTVDVYLEQLKRIKKELDAGLSVKRDMSWKII